MREVEKPPVNGEAEPTPMLIDPPREPEREPLPTPPSSCELDDFPAIFDLPSDVIYASVNELPKKDGSSLSQLPIYGPPTLTDEPYHNPVEDLPIVPISKFCLERYVVPMSNWEPPNRHYRQSTPEHPDDILEISREVQVEPVPTFAPAGTGKPLWFISNDQKPPTALAVDPQQSSSVHRHHQTTGSIKNPRPGSQKKNVSSSSPQKTTCTISISSPLHYPFQPPPSPIWNVVLHGNVLRNLGRYILNHKIFNLLALIEVSL